MKKYSTQPGHRFPFGATFDSRGTDCSVWGRFATRVELLSHERTDSPAPSDVTWHGTKLNEPLWNNPDAQILAYTLGRKRDGEEDLHIIFNMSDQVVEMPLPSLSGRTGYRSVDTGQPSSGDILEPADQIRMKESSYLVSSHSVVVFESR